MGKVIIEIVDLIIGFIGGAIFDGSLIGGTAAGIGIATEASAGIGGQYRQPKTRGHRRAKKSIRA